MGIPGYDVSGRALKRKVCDLLTPKVNSLTGPTAVPKSRGGSWRRLERLRLGAVMMSLVGFSTSSPDLSADILRQSLLGEKHENTPACLMPWSAPLPGRTTRHPALNPKPLRMRRSWKLSLRLRSTFAANFLYGLEAAAAHQHRQRHPQHHHYSLTTACGWLTGL